MMLVRTKVGRKLINIQPRKQISFSEKAMKISTHKGNNPYKKPQHTQKL